MGLLCLSKLVPEKQFLFLPFNHQASVIRFSKFSRDFYLVPAAIF